VRVVGLDNFSAGYIRGHGAANTERNLGLAGIAERATVQPGDMRDMPFADGSFDAAASSAAIDHLDTGDLHTTLGEVRRVLKPGGQFLLLVSVPNVWLMLAFGPLIAGRLKDRAFWRAALAGAGLAIEREGTVRTHAMFLARRP
jgi:SAM-dependent methyltransferase